MLYELGEYGPFILLVISWILLWNYKNLFFYYNVGLFANTILNLVLKGIIQEPRPMYDSKKVTLAKTHAKKYFFQNGIPFDIFGMPSGHAQMVFYTTIFIYMALKNFNITCFYLLYSLIICYQRVKYDFHSLSQVIVGSITGGAFGYLIFNVAREKLKGKIREKPDDNGPI
jgi:membrane-associated phospholipid phosphatase